MSAEILDFLFSQKEISKKQKEENRIMNKIFTLVGLIGLGALSVGLLPIFAPSFGEDTLKGKLGEERSSLERVQKYCFNVNPLSNDTATCDLWLEKYRIVKGDLPGNFTASGIGADQMVTEEEKQRVQAQAQANMGESN